MGIGMKRRSLGAAKTETNGTRNVKMKAMKTRLVNLKKGLVTALGCLALTCMTWGPDGTAQAQSDPANLPPGVQDVLKLTRAGLSEDLILTQVRTSGATYSLTADQIIYLSNQGVSQNVIKAIMPPDGSAPPAPAPAPAATAYAPAPAYVPPAPAPAYVPSAQTVAAPAPDAPPPVSMDYFQAQLQPYGRWVNVYGAGLCWVPAEGADPSWRPYFNSGHWVYTDQGWFWQSDYAWGEIAFHYGRWFRNGAYGWVWAPGYDWAPAWVSWRYAEADGCCGWAPLPLEARFDLGVGLWWHGGLALDADFGLPFDSFVFIGFGNFWVHDYRTVFIGRDRVRGIFARSVIHNGYRMDRGRFACDGFGRERMAQLTHRDIRVSAAHEIRSAEEHRNIDKRVAEHPRLAESAQRHVAAATARTTVRTSTTETRTTGARTGTTPERTSTFTRNAATTTSERTTTPGRATTTERTAAGGRSPATTQGGSTRSSFTDTRTTTTTTRTSESTTGARTVPGGTTSSRSAYGSGGSSSAGSTANSQSRNAAYGSSTAGQRGSTPSGGGSSVRQSGSSEKSSSGR
jgi:hypothetical protein